MPEEKKIEKKSKYSQHEEEIHILEYFGGHKGRFLDIGAYTGLELSNTRRLAELGWSGVMVEPAAGPFRKLLENYKDFPEVDLVNVAIWTAYAAGFTEFQQAGDDAVGSLASSKEHIKTWHKAVPFQKSYVMAVHVGILLSLFENRQYDFINLDVEGSNWEILQTIPWGGLGTKLVCVETDQYRKEMHGFLGAFGFTKVVYESYENLIMGVE